MYVNVDIPPVLLEKLMERAKVHGLRRPQIVRYALQRFVQAEYPVIEIKFVCPQCAAGRHCGNTMSEKTFDINSVLGAERMIQWVCVCEGCRAELPEPAVE